MKKKLKKMCQVSKKNLETNMRNSGVNLFDNFEQI